MAVTAANAVVATSFRSIFPLHCEQNSFLISVKQALCQTSFPFKFKHLYNQYDQAMSMNSTFWLRFWPQRLGGVKFSDRSLAWFYQPIILCQTIRQLYDCSTLLRPRPTPRGRGWVPSIISTLTPPVCAATIAGVKFSDLSLAPLSVTRSPPIADRILPDCPPSYTTATPFLWPPRRSSWQRLGP